MKYYHYDNTGDMSDKKILKVTHNAGFFSNMTIRLLDLLSFMQEHGKYPDEIDSTVQFSFYKDEPVTAIDHLYITKPVKNIKFNLPDNIRDCMAIQFANYKTIDFKHMNPIIENYFNPGDYVKEKVQFFKDKYNLTEYISVFYRGNDKSLETQTASYETFFKKCEEVRLLEPNLPFLVQPDECRFAEEFKKRFNNVIIFEETKCVDGGNVSFSIPLGQRTEYGALFNAACLLQAKGKHLITHSGNCGLWASLYRGNAKNIHQCYKDKFYE